MSLSSPITFTTLPSSLTQPELHDGRSGLREIVKLANQTRNFLTATYEAIFDFETPGDNTYHNAWGCQLRDASSWYASVTSAAMSGAGSGARWNQEALITRTGATVTIVSDSVLSSSSTAGLVNFAMQWSVSGLYAYLQLRDDVALPGFWRVRLKVTEVQ